jgi:hypothetical protein
MVKRTYVINNKYKKFNNLTKMDNKSKLYNNIMKTVSEQVKQSLNEFDEIAPKKQEIVGNVYLIRCDGMSKKAVDTLSAKISKFDNYGSGNIRIVCKTPAEVLKSIQIIIELNILDDDNSLGTNPRISIQKVSRNSMNDSVNEGRSTDIQRQYIQASKITAPRQKAKFDIITQILNGELDRDPDLIREAMIETGLWDNRSEGQIQMDVNLIMKKTEPDEEMEGDFTTSYVYSRDSFDAETFGNGLDAAENHVKWLIKHGMDVTVTEKRYDYKIDIHYSTKQQYKDLVNWLAWHCGYTDTISSTVSGEDKREVEDIIASGSNRSWR